jgi:hypothetical protein
MMMKVKARRAERHAAKQTFAQRWQEIIEEE